ncbi:MAG: hypothetical protein R3C14_41580 [Caldilineaceae bacterium]
MKLFLVFLFASFIAGMATENTTAVQRIRLMAGIAVGIAALYFFADRFI